MKINRRILCKDGTSFSCQANSFAYSEPREDNAYHYSLCEVGFIEGRTPSTYLMEYADPLGSVFGYVPVGVVEMFIEECGGIDLGRMLGEGGFSNV